MKGGNLVSIYRAVTVSPLQCVAPSSPLLGPVPRMREKEEVVGEGQQDVDPPSYYEAIGLTPTFYPSPPSPPPSPPSLFRISLIFFIFPGILLLLLFIIFKYYIKY